MPEISAGGIVLGLLAVILSRYVPVRRDPSRPMPFWASVLVGCLAAYVGPPVFDIVVNLWRKITFLPEITEGMVFLGLFMAVFLQFVVERKDRPRRIPVWAVVVISVATAFALPPLIYRLTGSYSALALRADVNQCAQGIQGETEPRHVSNTCDFPIVVGLCAPGEENPAPCAQTVALAPGETTSLDPDGARLAYAPGNRDGLSVVACRPPNRPSRMMNQTNKYYVGVCLPAL
ncbi:hypothetical protein [Pseudosulfitobacter pseudonitzschiae]|uniref:hypothetical protein n=1 Tax=Pseudosulfitobacter pseudonitzschiae TaxID=1402135 RepID=UPI001AF851A8|nr:hypothetical protein [Pseudosulfitobacter pseudonitzschiae]MBM1813966.1 hypothetical protein [Pseudosulfitobacter pseudonitzschiae]MBM1830959.1 hypothetical protein [Pseudosulfitobacter pseudonitzschiae]MBM1835826.1 hypothetical protein [Pseudosulfitobacter pseudonitzschiae]MBM1840672.1 hypothetical protein [Pseudosulfitobacter pseudonitzschiae]MBM1845340.1 hypothetical protein [Pseudosulfitobacter pseudonitzschiae]